MGHMPLPALFLGLNSEDDQSTHASQYWRSGLTASHSMEASCVLRMLATPGPITMCLLAVASSTERSRLVKQDGLSPGSAL